MDTVLLIAFWIGIVVVALILLVLLILAIAVTPILIDMMLFEETSWASEATIPTGPEEVVFFRQGILARGSEQFAPLGSAFRGSHVYTLDMGGIRHNVQALAEIVATYIDVVLARGQRVHLVGVSLGGVETPLIVERITASKKNLRVTLVDSPAGIKTLAFFAMLPSFMHPPLKWLFIHLKPGELTNRLYGDRVLGLLKELPKRENIEVPVGENLKEYQDTVIAKAEAGLSGHKFSVWWSQLAFMLKNDVPYEALHDVPVTYMWCGLGDENENGVVVQPLACDIWKENVPNLKFMRVESTHAGFLEKQPTWLKAFSSAE